MTSQRQGAVASERTWDTHLCATLRGWRCGAAGRGACRSTQQCNDNRNYNGNTTGTAPTHARTHAHSTQARGTMFTGAPHRTAAASPVVSAVFLCALSRGTSLSLWWPLRNALHSWEQWRHRWQASPRASVWWLTALLNKQQARPPSAPHSFEPVVLHRLYHSPFPFLSLTAAPPISQLLGHPIFTEHVKR